MRLYLLLVLVRVLLYKTRGDERGVYVNIRPLSRASMVAMIGRLTNYTPGMTDFPVIS